MRSARDGRGSGETMGCLKGGHERLVLAVADRARECGVDIRLGAGVEGLVRDPDGRIAGVQVDGHPERLDLTIATLQPPPLRRPPPFAPHPARRLPRPLPRRRLPGPQARRSLLPYYSVNICDPTPITTVVERPPTVLAQAIYTDGLRLAYLPKYCDPGAPEFSEDDESIYRRFTEMLARLAPDFRHEDVVDWTVQRAPLVEPVHALDHEPRVAPVWPGVDGLALASASQIYPRLLNGESVVEMAERVAGEALERVQPRGVAAERDVAHAAAA
jgi:protoporphyrinogen oxidase